MSSSKVRLAILLLAPLPMLGLAGCAAPRPEYIKLNPPQALPPPPVRPAARSATARPRPPRPSGDAADPSCAPPGVQALPAPRKAELFRQFAALQGAPVDSAAPAPAPPGLPPCPPAAAR